MKREVLAGTGGGFALRAREFIAGKDAVTPAHDILTLDQEQFSAAFRKSPMKRAKMGGLQRNATVVLGNAGMRDERPVPQRRRDT